MSGGWGGGWSYVMVSFSKRNQSREHVVSRRISVIEGLVAKPMRKRIDTESSLLDNCKFQSVNYFPP